MHSEEAGCKVCQYSHPKRSSQFAGPMPTGIENPLGVEAAVHAAQIYLCILQSDQVIVKVEFDNVFNIASEETKFC